MISNRINDLTPVFEVGCKVGRADPLPADKVPFTVTNPPLPGPEPRPPDGELAGAAVDADNVTPLTTITDPVAGRENVVPSTVTADPPGARV
jgi:hypothetical protein